MGKTKTAFVSDTIEEKKPSYDKAAKEAKRKAKEDAEKIHLPGLKGGQRVVAIEAEPTEEQALEASSAEAKKEKRVRTRSKKYQEARSKVDRNKLYPLSDAVALVKTTSLTSFDGSVELHLLVKKAGLSANITLPHSSGKVKKVEVADEATLEKLKSGKVDFDVLLATAEMMPKLVSYAKLLGPKGLMPNPKNGTLIKSEKDASRFSGNSTSIKTEKDAPIIHLVAGKVSQNENELVQNIETILNAFPKQIVKAYVKATMGPSIKVQV